MACKDQTITLARDVELVSFPNGDAQFYWVSAQLWAACLGAAALDVLTNILTMVSGTIVHVIAERGSDGISYVPLTIPGVTPGDPSYIDGAGTGGITTPGERQYQFTGQPEDYNPYFRIGLRISHPTLQGVCVLRRPGW